MLVATFNNLDPSNIDSMKDAISNMATGMSTALLTTLAGLLGSLAVKLQLVNQDA
jgi:biopolymer transport protein ExbB/TolQ